MPGVFNLSIDEALKEAESAAVLGIGGLLLFGLPGKGRAGSGAWADNGIVQRALRALKTSRLAASLVDRRRLPLRIHLARPLRHREEIRQRL